MSNYFHVTEGSIDDGPRPLPGAWKDHGFNVTGLKKASTAELKAYGWLPQIKVNDDASYNPATHKLTGPVNVVGDDDVTSTWTVAEKSQGEIDSDTAIVAAEKSEKSQEAVDYVTGELLRLIVNEIPQVLSTQDITIAELKTHLEAL